MKVEAEEPKLEFRVDFFFSSCFFSYFLMSGNTFWVVESGEWGTGTSCVEAKGADRHPVMYGLTLTVKNYLGL